MLIEQTLTMLHALKLTGMAAALEAQRGLPDLASLAFEDRCGFRPKLITRFAPS